MAAIDTASLSTRALVTLTHSETTAGAFDTPAGKELARRMRGMTQAMHTELATYLMHAACGDLIFSKSGNLCARIAYDHDTGRDLPWQDHRIGACLASITRDGWTLTPQGIEWILENCPPEGGHRAKAQRRALERAANLTFPVRF